MKTKLFLLTSLLSGGILFVSCQKDNEMAPAENQEETLALDNAANLMKSDLIEPKDDLYADPLSVYPNPFVNQTSIQFRVIRTNRVTLTVYHENGISIRCLYDGYLQKGVYKKVFDATDLPAGIYVAELKLGDRVCKEIMIKKNKMDPMPNDGISEN